MERPVGQVERVGPVPELEVARDEGAATEPAAMPAVMLVQPVVEPAQPVTEVPEAAVPEWSEGSSVVASSTALDEAGASGQMAAASGGGLGAGPSGLSGEGVSWAVVQRGVPEDFVRAKHEEEEIWQEQLELGGTINADLQRAVQRHWQEAHNVTRVSALPAPVHFQL